MKVKGKLKGGKIAIKKSVSKYISDQTRKKEIEVSTSKGKMVFLPTTGYEVIGARKIGGKVYKEFPIGKKINIRGRGRHSNEILGQSKRLINIQKKLPIAKQFRPAKIITKKNGKQYVSWVEEDVGIKLSKAIKTAKNDKKVINIFKKLIKLNEKLKKMEKKGIIISDTHAGNIFFDGKNIKLADVRPGSSGGGGSFFLISPFYEHVQKNPNISQRLKNEFLLKDRKHYYGIGKPFGDAFDRRYKKEVKQAKWNTFFDKWLPWKKRKKQLEFLK